MFAAPILDPAVLAAALGAVASLLGGLVSTWLASRQERRSGPVTLDERIPKLTNALRESTRIASEVEREIATRSQAVEKLRQEQELLELDREQVEAVAQTLRGELRREGKRSFWISVAQNMVFFGLGVLATVV